MILYLDSSALVKRYIAERGSEIVAGLIATAEFVGTSLVTRAETAAALGKAVRIDALTREEGMSALHLFRQEWTDFIRVQMTETIVARADTLAWELELRGYDAVQLACALHWKNGMDEDVTFATFDRTLWDAAGRRNLLLAPDDLPQLLDTWHT